MLIKLLSPSVIALMLIMGLAPDKVLPPKPFTGKVVAIADGDTVTVLYENQQHKIRLSGIDAPESRQAFGDKSKKALADKVFGKEVKVEWSAQDKYHRILGEIYLGERRISEEMISEGLAWHYKQYSKDQNLAKAELAAKQAKKGLWADANPTPPWDFRRGGTSVKQIPPEVDPAAKPKQGTTVYITDTGEKYHRENCKYLAKSSNPILMEKLGANYQPCKVCSPPPRGAAPAKALPFTESVPLPETKSKATIPDSKVAVTDLKKPLPSTTKVSTTLSADDLRICNEILLGDTSNTRKLKAISKEAAKELAENTKTGLEYKRGVNGDIYLDGLLSLELDIAKALAPNKGSIYLMSVKTLGIEEAKAIAPQGGFLYLPAVTTLGSDVLVALAGHKGYQIHLNGLESIDGEAARAFGKYKGVVYMKGLKRIDKETAQAFIDYQYLYTLQGLTHINKELATILLECKGDLFFDSLESLDPEIAAILVPRKKALGFASLKALDSELAKVLAEHEGILGLNGVKTITPEVIQIIVNHKGPIGLNGLNRDDKKAWNEALVQKAKVK